MDRMIGNPDWGKISVALGEFQGDATYLFEKIKSCWLGLEAQSAQRLFIGQLNTRSSATPILDLYGPRESFARLVDELAAAGAEQSIIDFHSMPYDEIYKLRDTEGN